MTKRSPVIIAGGGIAGLCAAIALARQGFHVRIFEKADHLSEQGAGVQLGPNATAILRHWGLEEPLLAASCLPETIALYDGVKGKILSLLPVGRFAREHWGAPYVTIHRGDLQKLLLEAIADHPLIELCCSAPVGTVSGMLGDGFTLEVRNKAETQKHHTDFFIACDGVWSSLHEKRAEFSGSIAWRATVTFDEGQSLAPTLFSDQNVRVFMGAGGHFILYPIRKATHYNLVAITKDKTALVDNHDKAQLKAAFAHWKMPIAHLIEQIDSWTYWPIFIRRKPHFLSPSGVVFLGDSAHAVTPFAAQGAAMAMEDAAVLARFLPDAMSISRQNLELFARNRQSRVLKVGRRGSFNQFVYHAGGVVAASRNLYMRRRASEKFLTDLDWLYGFRQPI